MGQSDAKILEQVTRIRDKFARVRNNDRDFQLFGAMSHEYKINPVLSEEEIAGFENEFGIRLPAEYRFFLKHIGDGGAGPYYGVQRLRDSLYEDLDYKDENSKVNPSEPFPHTSAWNLDPEDFPGGEKYRDRYFAPEHANGLLRLCNFGCGIFMNLVVNGPEYGNMWTDDRCNGQGIYPFFDFDEDREIGRINFLDWYELWLDKALAQTEKSKL